MSCPDVDAPSPLCVRPFQVTDGQSLARDWLWLLVDYTNALYFQRCFDSRQEHSRWAVGYFSSIQLVFFGSCSTLLKIFLVFILYYSFSSSFFLYLKVRCTYECVGGGRGLLRFCCFPLLYPILSPDLIMRPFYNSLLFTQIETGQLNSQSLARRRSLLHSHSRTNQPKTPLVIRPFVPGLVRINSFFLPPTFISHTKYRVGVL